MSTQAIQTQSESLQGALLLAFRILVPFVYLLIVAWCLGKQRPSAHKSGRPSFGTIFRREAKPTYSFRS